MDHSLSTHVLKDMMVASKFGQLWIEIFKAKLPWASRGFTWGHTVRSTTYCHTQLPGMIGLLSHVPGPLPIPLQTSLEVDDVSCPMSPRVTHAISSINTCWNGNSKYISDFPRHFQCPYHFVLCSKGDLTQMQPNGYWKRPCETYRVQTFCQLVF
jgi:hypothetical protein